VARDVAEDDGEFVAGKRPVEPFGAQPPGIEAGHLQRVGGRVRQQVGLGKQGANGVHPLPPARDHPALAVVQPAHRRLGNALLGVSGASKVQTPAARIAASLWSSNAHPTVAMPTSSPRT